MSSEEDWSIISSSSDLDEDQATIESNSDDVRQSENGNNVSSIATLKIPVLEAGSSPRSNVESPDNTIEEGNSVATISGSDTDVSAPGSRSGSRSDSKLRSGAALQAILDEDDALQVAAADKNNDANNAKSGDAAPPSRIHNTIEYYEGLAKDFRAGIATSFSRHFGGDKKTQAEVDGATTDSGDTDASVGASSSSSDGASTASEVSSTAVDNDTDEASTIGPIDPTIDHTEYRRIEEAISRLTRDTGFSQFAYLAGIVTLLVSSIASIYLLGPSLMVPSPPVLEEPSLWAQVWNPLAGPPPPPPSGNFFSSFLWKSSPPPVPKSEIEKFRESLDNSAIVVFQSGEKIKKELQDLNQHSIDFLKKNVIDEGTVKKLKAQLNAQLQQLSKFSKRSKVFFDEYSARFEKNFSDNSIRVAKFLQKNSIVFGKKFQKNSVVLARNLKRNSILFGKRAHKHSVAVSKLAKVHSLVLFSQLKRELIGFNKDLKVQSKNWWNFSSKQSKIFRVQTSKLAKKYYTKLQEYNNVCRDTVEKEGGLVHDFLKKSALTSYKLNENIRLWFQSNI